jgi:hypothetical protein
MFGVGHLDIMPLVYGVIMFLGIWSMWHKFHQGYFMSFLGEAAVFGLVFWLHGGTMSGGFAAMIAALIAGNTIFRPKAKQITQGDSK